MESIDLASGLSALNVLLLAVLLYVYAQNYRRMKSKFILGLIFFAALLFLQNAAALYFQTIMVMYYTAQVSNFVLVLNLLESLGLLVLLYNTFRH